MATPSSGQNVSVTLELGSEKGREAALTMVRDRVERVFKGVPVQPAYVKAIGDRAEKALNRLLHECGLPQVGTQHYKPAGRKAS